MKKNRKEIDVSIKELIVYGFILSIGILALVLVSTLLKGVVHTILLSLSTGLIASSLTAGLIEISQYIDFKKKWKYRRSVELRHLSREVFSLAQMIAGDYTAKNLEVLSNKLSIAIPQEKEDYIISCIDTQRGSIARELNAIRENQNYLLLSGFFTNQEVSFLCRSINHYNKTTTKENYKYVIQNIIDYIEMFADTLKWQS